MHPNSLGKLICFDMSEGLSVECEGAYRRWPTSSKSCCASLLCTISTRTITTLVVGSLIKNNTYCVPPVPAIIDRFNQCPQSVSLLHEQKLHGLTRMLLPPWREMQLCFAFLAAKDKNPLGTIFSWRRCIHVPCQRLTKTSAEASC